MTIYKFEVTIEVNNNIKNFERYVLANNYDTAEFSLVKQFLKSDDVKLIKFTLVETIFPLICE